MLVRSFGERAWNEPVQLPKIRHPLSPSLSSPFRPVLDQGASGFNGPSDEINAHLFAQTTLWITSQFQNCRTAGRPSNKIENSPPPLFSTLSVDAVRPLLPFARAHDLGGLAVNSRRIFRSSFPIDRDVSRFSSRRVTSSSIIVIRFLKDSNSF